MYLSNRGACPPLVCSAPSPFAAILGQLKASAMAPEALLPRVDAVQEPAAKPNILLLFPDQWRWDWTTHAPTGAPPPALHTPNFDALAAAGVRFDYAYVPAPLCGPSRSALALGREHDMTGVEANQDVEREMPGKTTVYRALRDAAGYHVMMSGKDDLAVPYLADGSHNAQELGYSAWKGRSPGKEHIKASEGPYTTFLSNQTVRMDNGSIVSALRLNEECLFSKVPDEQEPSQWSGAACCRPGTEYSCSRSLPNEWPEAWYYDNWVGHQALQMLKERPADKPWFLQVNWPGPHPPLGITASMRHAVGGLDFEMPIDDVPHTESGQFPVQPHDHLWARRAYAAEIENIDSWFGKFVEAVQQLGDDDNTLICITSDHGEMLGDHGRWAKGKPCAQLSNPFKPV